MNFTKFFLIIGILFGLMSFAKADDFDLSFKTNYDRKTDPNGKIAEKKLIEKIKGFKNASPKKRLRIAESRLDDFPEVGAYAEVFYIICFSPNKKYAENILLTNHYTGSTYAVNFVHEQLWRIASKRSYNYLKKILTSRGYFSRYVAAPIIQLAYLLKIDKKEKAAIAEDIFSSGFYEGWFAVGKYDPNPKYIDFIRNGIFLTDPNWRNMMLKTLNYFRCKEAVDLLIDIYPSPFISIFKGDAEVTMVLQDIVGFNLGDRPNKWRRWWKENRETFEFDK